MKENYKVISRQKQSLKANVKLQIVTKSTWMSPLKCQFSINICT